MGLIEHGNLPCKEFFLIFNRGSAIEMRDIETFIPRNNYISLFLWDWIPLY